MENEKFQMYPLFCALRWGNSLLRRKRFNFVPCLRMHFSLFFSEPGARLHLAAPKKSNKALFIQIFHLSPHGHHHVRLWLLLLLLLLLLLPGGLLLLLLLHLEVVPKRSTHVAVAEEEDHEREEKVGQGVPSHVGLDRKRKGGKCPLTNLGNRRYSRDNVIQKQYKSTRWKGYKLFLSQEPSNEKLLSLSAIFGGGVTKRPTKGAV